VDATTRSGREGRFAISRAATRGWRDARDRRMISVGSHHPENDDAAG
jgi:hypothetical protein